METVGMLRGGARRSRGDLRAGRRAPRTYRAVSIPDSALPANQPHREHRHIPIRYLHIS